MSKKSLFKTADKDPQMSFVALADVHLRGNEKYRARRMKRALKKIAKMKFADAFVILGDVTDHGYKEQWELTEKVFSAFDLPPTILVMGNHDAWTNEGDSQAGFDEAIGLFLEYSRRITGDTSDKVYFRRDVKGFTFLILGSERPAEEAYISNEQLNWLDSELSSISPDRPVFVLSHYAIAGTHGLPKTSGSDNYDRFTGSFGEQSPQINAVLQKHRNVILFSGHSHMGFANEPTYSTFERYNDIYTVNLPCYMFPNHDGLFAWGCGMIVELYADKIVFSGANFLLGGRMEKYTYTIPRIK